jgi:hypothetical protein
MSTTTLPKINFLNEWTPKNFSGIEKAIARHFKGRMVSQNYGCRLTNGNFRHIDEVLGLAYTSSSSYALYCICNVELKYDNTEFNYQFFAISGDSKYYAILWDKDENERIIEL